jgi:cell division septal protein FtsQ
MNVKVKVRFIAILFLFLSLLGYLFGWSSLLEVRNIEVAGIEGSKTLTSKKVISKSGIATGDKLARVNAGAVARSLRIYPEIARVEINRKPLHTVEIALTLRKVEIALATNQGRYLLGDVNGITFAEVSRPQREFQLSRAIAVLSWMQLQSTTACPTTFGRRSLSLRFRVKRQLP